MFRMNQLAKFHVNIIFKSVLATHDIAVRRRSPPLWRGGFVLLVKALSRARRGGEGEKRKVQISFEWEPVGPGRTNRAM